LVKKWNTSGNVPRIERDMALEELRRIYDELLDYTPQQESHPAAEIVAPAVAEREAQADHKIEDNGEAEAVAAEDEDDAFEDALDIDALLGLSGEDSIAESRPAEPVVAEPEVVIDTEPAAEPAPVAAEPEPVSVPEPVVEPESVVEPEVVPAEVVAEQDRTVERSNGGGLFDIDDIPVRAKSGRKMISLYDTPVKRPAPVREEVAEPAVEPAVVESVEPAPAPMPAPAPQPVVAQFEEEVPQRLGDVIAKNVTTLADKMAEEQPTTAFNRITDIRKAIGLNDKFLMIRDLFGGDAKLYEQTITRLNEFDDLDECMIFIVENFRWNPDSEGAKFLVSLLERKLS
jgi:hypothetical protein